MVVVEGTEMQYVFLRRNLGHLNPWLDIKNERENSQQQLKSPISWVDSQVPTGKLQRINLGRHDMLKLVFTCLQVKVEVLGPHGEAW